MRIGFEPDYNLDKELEKFKELLTLQKQLSENTKLLRFIGIREMTELTGWSLPTVQNLYNRPDFPSCDFGKEKMAEISAVIKYFSVPRRKTS